VCPDQDPSFRQIVSLWLTRASERHAPNHALEDAIIKQTIAILAARAVT